MSKRPKPLSEQKFSELVANLIEQLTRTRLDVLMIETALKEKGLLSDADFAQAVVKVTREGKKSLDDLAANPEKAMAMLRGKRDDVQ